MANTVQVPVVAGNLPQGFCPQSEQARLNGYAAVMTVALPAAGGSIIWQQTKPADTSQTWGQLDSLGRPVRIYLFAAGSWLAQHPQVPGAIMLWDGPLPDFTVFDGGDSVAAGPTSGPMWEEVVAARARFPIHPGTLPVAGTIPVAGTGGEEQVTLDNTQLAAHTHRLTTLGRATADGNDGSPSGGLVDTGGPSSGSLGNTTDSDGGGQPHDNMPPYYGAFLLRRTNRLFYAVA